MARIVTRCRQKRGTQRAQRKNGEDAEDIGLVDPHQELAGELSRQSGTPAHCAALASAVTGDNPVFLRVLCLFLSVLCVPCSRV
jgi:hypothetical protein